MASQRHSLAPSAISSAISEEEEPQRPISGVSYPSQSAAHSSRRETLQMQYTHSNANSSRPQSPASRVSRSHVPSLTSHAFFRPMTSQQAQRQRGTRPNTAKSGPSPFVDAGDGQSDAGTEPNRTSISTVPQGLYIRREESDQPPSRGTEYTEPPLPDRTTNASPAENTTVRSLGDNVRLLKDRGTRPQNLSLGNNFKDGVSQEPPQRSPKGSFRSNLSLGAKRLSLGPGHQHLSSTASSPRLDMAKAPEKPQEQPYLGRNHEYFEGNTVFFFGGRLQNARDRPINIATCMFVVIPSVLFFIFSAPWMWHHVSPAIPIVFAYIFYICISSFIHASTVDPGILPRNVQPFPPTDPNADPLALGPPLNDWVMVKLATSETAAMDVPVKYCKTCNVWRPPRCYHCRVCDSCIETLDHHCVWLNNCVGRRNYRYFFTFISSATVLATYLIGISLAQVLLYRSQEKISFGASINHFRVPFALFIYGILGVPYPASLWVYHLYLTGKGETTREYLNSHKFAKADRHLPFTQGNLIKNWITVLARPRPPTYLRFKEKYRQGDQRFGTRKDKKQPRDIEAQTGMELKPIEGPSKPFEGPSGRPKIPSQNR